MSEYSDQQVGRIVEMVIFVIDRIFPYSYSLAVTQGTSTVPWLIRLEPLGSERSKYVPGAFAETIIKPKAVWAWVGDGKTEHEYAAGIIAGMITKLLDGALTPALKAEVWGRAKAVLNVSKLGDDLGAGGVLLSRNDKRVETEEGQC